MARVQGLFGGRPGTFHTGEYGALKHMVYKKQSTGRKYTLKLSSLQGPETRGRVWRQAFLGVKDAEAGGTQGYEHT